MTVVYDNWERLVTAVLRREELWLSGLRTPSDVFSLSSASASPSFNFSSNPRQVSSLSSWSLLVGELFTYHQILKATDFLSDSNLIKHGHSGKLFYGVLEGGTEVVVKKVDLSCVENELCFMSELEICGMLYHSRLVPLLGHCLENGHEKFLVYKYTPNKDLASFMRYDKIKQLPSLDWAVRLKIATGVAEGLCYLHDKCFPPLVHRDIQASSILLDDDFEVRLGSLTAVCIEEQVYNQRRLSQAIQNARSSGNSTASWNYVFSEVNANEEVYPCSGILANSNLRIFTYLELKAATRNFKVDTFLGGGAFGRVYKGLLRQKSTYCGTETVIAVKKVYAEYIPQFQRWRVIPRNL